MYSIIIYIIIVYYIYIIHIETFFDVCCFRCSSQTLQSHRISTISMVGRFATVEKQVTIIGTTRGHHHAIALCYGLNTSGFFQVGFLGLAENSKAGKVRRNRRAKPRASSGMGAGVKVPLPRQLSFSSFRSSSLKPRAPQINLPISVFSWKQENGLCRIGCTCKHWTTLYAGVCAIGAYRCYVLTNSCACTVTTCHNHA